MSILLSVVICTYNRISYLKDAIDSLIDQESVHRDIYEIVIIDNGSTDNTKSTVCQYIRNNKRYNIKYYFEKIPGLAHARNTGYKKSQGKYVAFLDDDAKADKKWLYTIINTIRKTNYSPLVIAGAVIPFYESGKPDWLPDEYEAFLPYDKETVLNEKDFISGQNMVFEKKLLVKTQGFPENVGMIKDNIMVGEETFLFEKIKNEYKNVKIVFSPKIKVFHSIPAFKTKIIYRLKRSIAGGKSLFYHLLEGSYIKRSAFLMKYLVGVPVIFFAVPFFIIYYKNFKIGILESMSMVFYGLGYIFTFFKLKINVKQK